jgi:hypothetical protein
MDFGPYNAFQSSDVGMLVVNMHLSSISCMKCRYVGGKYMHFMSTNNLEEEDFEHQLARNLGKCPFTMLILYSFFL